MGCRPPHANGRGSANARPKDRRVRHPTARPTSGSSARWGRRLGFDSRHQPGRRHPDCRAFAWSKVPRPDGLLRWGPAFNRPGLLEPDAPLAVIPLAVRHDPAIVPNPAPLVILRPTSNHEWIGNTAEASWEGTTGWRFGIRLRCLTHCGGATSPSPIPERPPEFGALCQNRPPSSRDHSPASRSSI